MIELDEIDRYAGAALFSLALLYYGPRRDLIHDL